MYQKRSNASEALLLLLLLFRGRFFASLLGCLRVTLGAPTAGWWLRDYWRLRRVFVVTIVAFVAFRQKAMATTTTIATTVTT